MVKVVFLCGGMGKRMSPITTDKFMLNFLGKTLLEKQIELAKTVGLNDFVIISNKRSIEKVKGICKTIEGNFEFVIQKEPKGMADALISAKEQLIDNEIIIVKTNDVFEISAYKKILEEYKKKEYDSYLLCYTVKKYFPGGYLSINEKDEINGLIEKPGEGNEPSNIINIVVHLHKKTRDLFEYLEKNKESKDNIYELAIDKMMKNNFKFKAVRYTDFWAAIPYPWSIFKIMNYFMNSIEQKIASTANIDRSAKIEGKVIIGDNTKIFENATIKGPCYIGKNCIIGNNTLIRASHISDNCVIGFSTEVKGSYICKDCWFHANYIGDSIIDSGCSFGSGSVTANLRFDEENIIGSGINKLGVIMGKNCRTGINSNIMPGIKVGQNSIIGAGVTLTSNLEKDKIAFLNSDHYQIKKNKFNIDIEKREEIKKKLER